MYVLYACTYTLADSHIHLSRGIKVFDAAIHKLIPRINIALTILRL